MLPVISYMSITSGIVATALSNPRNTSSVWLASFTVTNTFTGSPTRS